MSDRNLPDDPVSYPPIDVAFKKRWIEALRSGKVQTAALVLRAICTRRCGGLAMTLMSRMTFSGIVCSLPSQPRRRRA